MDGSYGEQSTIYFTIYLPQRTAFSYCIIPFHPVVFLLLALRQSCCWITVGGFTMRSPSATVTATPGRNESPDNTVHATDNNNQYSRGYPLCPNPSKGPEANNNSGNSISIPRTLLPQVSACRPEYIKMDASIYAQEAKLCSFIW